VAEAVLLHGLLGVVNLGSFYFHLFSHHTTADSLQSSSLDTYVGFKNKEFRTRFDLGIGSGVVEMMCGNYA
jgi:hypothetical protein